MSDARSLRRKEKVSYTVSDDSDVTGSPSGASSTFSPGRKSRRVRKITELSDDELEEIEPPKTPPPRTSSAGHSLRQHKDLHLSLRAQQNGDKPVLKKRKLSRGTQNQQQKDSIRVAAPIPQRTARNEIRDTIASKTAIHRASFFVSKKDYFLPLLPSSNYITKLAEQRSQDGKSEDLTVPYEAITTQPKGVMATMKPYQLSGLSFLVYLQKNGLSGILGDEMGLGKTLQTLALIQYLKENRPRAKIGDETRPSLVVCPMSVLSSWMAEAKKWTPGLKVLRFHGPVKERDRMKKIATGEEDQYGNMTRRAIRKKQKRRVEPGNCVINLDSDEDAEKDAAYDLIVTTYEGFQSEQSWFKKAFVWRYVVLDEGHKIKNDLSQISSSLQGLGAEYRLILTGTPLQNNLKELWALLHWLYPEVFTDKTGELFKSSFDLTRGKVDTSVMDDARRLLELIMLRRMKSSPGVNLGLPPKTEVLLFVPLTPMQRFWYTRLLTRADQGLLEEVFQGAKVKEVAAIDDEIKTKQEWEDKDISELEALEKDFGNVGAGWEESKEIMKQAVEHEQHDDSRKSAWRKLMNLLMQLRKCCNHPYILPHAGPDPYWLGEHVINASGKFIVLNKIINELVITQKKKILIFSGFTKMLDCCEDLLALRGGDGSHFKYCRLDGGTARARRNLGIRMFNKEESEYQVMLISTRAGGLGINLATASDVVLLDQDWNPQITLQAEARAHRIGQTKPVTVYKLCTQGTVEEQMMGRIQKKLYLSAKVTESMRDIHSTAAPKSKKARPNAAEEDVPQLDTSQLISLLRRGAQTLSRPEIDVDEIISWDWATTLEKCKDMPADTRVSEQTQKDPVIKPEDEKEWLSQMEQVESRVFQGKKWAKEADNNGYGGIQQEWAREERRKGKNTTVMVDGFAVNKESMLCGDWEAVPTLAGKDPRLAEPKREKKPAVNNQEHCQVCWDGGDLHLCSGCPRSYHYKCLDKTFKAAARGKMQFHCPQHQCFDCEKKTSEAGGMIYRCRWCERGYCEDCLDWDKTELLGENLTEFELLAFPAVDQAFYVRCPMCTEHHEEDPEALRYCEEMASQFKAEYEEMLDKQNLDVISEEDTKKALLPSSRADSLTDATTLEDSGMTTPSMMRPASPTPPSSRKQKAARYGKLQSNTKKGIKASSLDRVSL